MNYYQKSKIAAGLLLSAALMASTAVHAQAEGETVLTSIDGTYTLSGELMGYDGINYQIVTDLGELFVRQEFVICSGANCPGAEVESVTETAEVILTALNDTIKITGTLVEVTSTSFVIDTATGQLTVRRELVTCEGQSCPVTDIQSDRFAVSLPGSSAADLMTTIIGEYAASKDFSLTQTLNTDGNLPDLLVGNERGLEVARIAFKESDNLTAAQALLDGSSALAITREPISIAVLSEAAGRDVVDVAELLEERVVGLDAISFAINPDNGIDVVGIDSIRSILSGGMTNWEQLGGANAPITLHLLASNSSLMDQLNARGMTTSELSANAVVHETVGDLIAALDADENAFGVMYRSQSSDVKVLNLAMSCNIFVDGSDFAVQTEEYPFSLRLYQYTLKSGIASAFANNVGQFITTDFGQQAIASRGLVTQELRIRPIQNQGSRLLSAVLASSGDGVSTKVMRDYISQVSTARRISTSLRFVSGSANLDRKAQEDLNRISEIVRSRQYEGYEVLVFGFSDSYGQLDANLSLSQRRANSVRDILLARNSGYLDLGNVSGFGIGPIAPVGCNTSDAGRQQNRRVEIWVRPKI